MFEEEGQASFICEELRRILGMETLSFSLLFRGQRDGFEYMNAFHELCDSKGPTLSLVKSRAGYLSAGFTKVPWETWDQQELGSGWRRDEDARIFQLTRGRKVYKPQNPEDAIYHGEITGPAFSLALQVGGCHLA